MHISRARRICLIFYNAMQKYICVEMWNIVHIVSKKIGTRRIWDTWEATSVKALIKRSDDGRSCSKWLVQFVPSLAFVWFFILLFLFSFLFGKPIKRHIDACTFPDKTALELVFRVRVKRTVTNCLQNYPRSRGYSRNVEIFVKNTFTRI